MKKPCLIFIFLIFTFATCDDFVKIDPPRTALVKATVFANDVTANAAMLDLYYSMQISGFASGGLFSLSLVASFSSDEQISYSTGTATSVAENKQFNDNALLPNNSLMLRQWSDMYKFIYKANAILEGLNSSDGVSESQRKQLEGEAKFVRAFCHFYLVNLWGDVPKIATTDYRVNDEISRTMKAEVYQQIISDLVSARDLLPSDYAFAGGERVRANKWAAAGMLARTYLFMGDWANAETSASGVIANSSLYSLNSNLNDVFLRNSTEAMLQLWSTVRANEVSTFYFTGTPTRGALRPQFVSDFEAGDLRRSIWVGTVSGYFRTQKYTSNAANPPANYSTVMRLAEQYLIRAEARAQQNNVTGAKADINVIRLRSGLPVTTASDQPSLLSAIEKERRSELFNEWGHRWLDLKRTNRADAALAPIKPQWLPTAVLFPIPETEMKNNSGLTNSQNPGY